MIFSLIVCTYKRRFAIENLLESVLKQTIYPDEIIIVDSSSDDDTKLYIEDKRFKNLKYFKVDDTNKGLTRQRNFGINQVDESSEIICFLDDDIILYPNYFNELLSTYKNYPEALGVGGYIVNEVKWTKVNSDYKAHLNQFWYDGYVRSEPSRFRIRKKIGLDSNFAPGMTPMFSHGRSLGFLPPSGEIYQVEQLMGGVSSFKKEVFKASSFSTYFIGYGLYEDADFSIRIAKQGKLYLNTNAQLEHHHDPSGRPNKYKYGKMVVRNGWYVWRVKNPNPLLKDRLKWNAITCLLLVIRATNICTAKKRKEAFTETLGRMVGYISLIFYKPK
ncbi:glycosyltransferase [Flavobacterium agricola]|uniref:Glycosyltransferase n=1 Tax=Flavobacterium agricola TaxID=2870839 RepID=A0ABY6LVZ6_9FLAO|nr:glycosyltransferase family 2 protein [Flavobacterium agricola]UYW00502.1 glycosyltransferase [Flavobacterium agricola]